MLDALYTVRDLDRDDLGIIGLLKPKMRLTLMQHMSIAAQ